MMHFKIKYEKIFFNSLILLDFFGIIVKPALFINRAKKP